MTGLLVAPPTRRRRTLLIGMVVLSLVLAGCGKKDDGGGRPERATERLSAARGGTVRLGNEVVVDVPAGALSADATITIRRGEGEVELPGAAPVSPLYEITTGGVALSSPVTVRLALPPGRPTESPQSSLAFVGRLDESGGRWESLGGTISGSDVVAQTTQFSKIRAFEWLPERIAAALVDAYVGVLRLTGARSKPPECPPPPPTTYTFQVVPILFRQVPDAPEVGDKDFIDTVLACPASAADAKATFKVVNNRSYSLLVSLPTGSTADPAPPGRLTEDVARYLRSLFADEFFLPSGAEAIPTVPLGAAETVRVQVKASQLSLALDAVLALTKVAFFSQAKYVDMLRCAYRTLGVSQGEPATLDRVPPVFRECGRTLLDGVGLAAFGLAYGIFDREIKKQVTSLDRTFDQILGGGEDVVLTSTAPRPTTTSTTTTTTTTRPQRSANEVAQLFWSATFSGDRALALSVGIASSYDQLRSYLTYVESAVDPSRFRFQGCALERPGKYICTHQAAYGPFTDRIEFFVFDDGDRRLYVGGVNRSCSSPQYGSCP